MPGSAPCSSAFVSGTIKPKTSTTSIMCTQSSSDNFYGSSGFNWEEYMANHVSNATFSRMRRYSMAATEFQRVFCPTLGLSTLSFLLVNTSISPSPKSSTSSSYSSSKLLYLTRSSYTYFSCSHLAGDLRIIAQTSCARLVAEAISGRRSTSCTALCIMWLKQGSQSCYR